MRNEGGGFAANIYEAMPESRIQMTSYQSLCAPIPQLPVTSHSFLLSNFQRYEKEREKASQVDDIREHPIHR